MGSLLLGLYDDERNLHHVGVASGMAAKLRTELLADVRPLEADALANHPWKDWADMMAQAESAGLMNGRFRHNARFRRWRADRDPDSCTYAQLEAVPPAELREMFADRSG